MSDYHILTQDEKQKTANVVFHIPFSATLNTAGITWQEAIVREQGGSENISSVLPGISVEEDTALKSGALLEVQKQVRFTSVNLTNAERLTEVEAEFVEIKTAIVAEKQVILDFIGYEGTVV